MLICADWAEEGKFEDTISYYIQYGIAPPRNSKWRVCSEDVWTQLFSHLSSPSVLLAIGWSLLAWSTMKSSVIPRETGYQAIEAHSSGAAAGVESLTMEELPQAIPQHPLGVRPSGNQFTATSISRNWIGSFRAFPDEILAVFLEYLDSHRLRLLGSTCKFLYAFCRSDDLWKTLFIE